MAATYEDSKNSNWLNWFGFQNSSKSTQNHPHQILVNKKCPEMFIRSWKSTNGDYRCLQNCRILMLILNVSKCTWVCFIKVEMDSEQNKRNKTITYICVHNRTIFMFYHVNSHWTKSIIIFEKFGLAPYIYIIYSRPSCIRRN